MNNETMTNQQAYELIEALEMSEAKRYAAAPRLSVQNALTIARAIAGDRCSVDLHQGEGPTDIAIVFHGCWKTTAHSVLGDVARAIGGTRRDNYLWAPFCNLATVAA